MQESKFEVELRQLINRYSQENSSNTPDFILAKYLIGCLSVFNLTIKQREKWYGRDSTPKGGTGAYPIDLDQFPRGGC